MSVAGQTITPLLTDSGENVDLTSLLTIGSLAITTVSWIQPVLRLSGLNGAAATITVKIVNTTDTETVWREAVVKDNAADTAMKIILPPFLTTANKTYSLKVLSSNSSDTTTADWIIDWCDAGKVAATIAAGDIANDAITAASIATGAFTADAFAAGALVADTFAASSLNGKGDWSTHNAAAVVSALGNGSTLTTCVTATGFSTHTANDVVTALGTGSTLTECATATGFAVAGDAMALTSDERTALVGAIEADLIDDETHEAVMAAILSKLDAAWPDIDSLTLSAIATAARDAILNRVLSGNHDTAGSVGKLLQDSATESTSAIIRAVLAGVTSIADNGDGTSTVTYYDTDGETALITVTCSNTVKGSRTASAEA